MGAEQDFDVENPHIAEMAGQVETGDITGFLGNVYKSTMVDRDDAMAWALIAALLIKVITDFIRRSGDVARPIIQVYADRMRDADADKAKEREATGE